jgi:hypothetical protein
MSTAYVSYKCPGTAYGPRSSSCQKVAYKTMPLTTVNNDYTIEIREQCKPCSTLEKILKNALDSTRPLPS